MKTTKVSPITKTETKNKIKMKIKTKTKTGKYNYMLRAVLALRLREPKIQNLCEGPETFGFFGFPRVFFGFPTEIQKNT